MSGFKITGLGVALPDTVITNDDFAETLDTSDEWIVERTGIKERRIGSSVWELGSDAAKNALKSASLEASQINTLILTTSSPHRSLPGTAARVSNELDFNGGAFDINAACAGFVYGLVIADGLIRTGDEKILLVGAEHLSSLVDKQDRATAVLFGDAAGAAILEVTSDESSLISYTLSTDGSQESILYCDIGGTIQMQGQEVFRKAVQLIVESCQSTLKKAGMTIDDVSIMVPHQANIRILSAACDRLGLPMEKVVEILSWTGNISTASVPVAMNQGIIEGRLNKGDIVLTVGFGAGMSAASALLRWDYEPQNIPENI